MGIQGLLKAVESVTVDKSLSDFTGSRVAVDGYVWLHRGVFFCAADIAKGKPSRTYISYFLNRVNQLRRCRAEAHRRACELSSLGRESEANFFYAKSVDVTPQMAYEVSLALRAEGVKVLVAPYEADAQLAFLSRNGLVDLVISEDSDLLVYGCPRVLYKVDFKSEMGKLVELSCVFDSCGGELFSRLTHDSLLVAAILSGCDYLPSFANVGLKTAISIALRIDPKADITSDVFLNRLLLLIKLAGIETDGIDFHTPFREAVLTFRHQVVFDPTLRVLAPLTPIASVPACVGELYASDLACGVADCVLHPESRLPFESVVKPAKESSSEQGLSRGNAKRSVPPKNSKCLQKPPQPISTRGTLAACWAYRTPMPTGAGFQSPIDLDSEEEEERIEANEAAKIKRPCDENVVPLEDLSNFDFGAYKRGSV